MKAPCLNVCVSNKDDQGYSVICNLKNILFAHLNIGGSPPVICRISMFKNKSTNSKFTTKTVFIEQDDQRNNLKLKGQFIGQNSLYTNN